MTPEKPNKICSHCRKGLPVSDPVGRREVCPFCGADLHVCFNCRFYDPASYNACREPQAERILSKDRSNFCDYFSFRNALDRSEGIPPVEPSTRDRLEALFKK